MGPMILLDKSSLQSMSQEEMRFLSNHYYLNIPPVLILEIIADLKKTKDDGLSEREVTILSKKLVYHDSKVNTDYKQLCIASFLGIPMRMNGCPAIMGAKELETTDGEKFILLDEQIEYEMLRNWQTSNFSESDIAFAQEWRDVCKKIDLEYFKRKLKEIFGTITAPLASLEELGAFIERLTSITDRNLQFSHMIFLMDEIGMNQKHKNLIYDRWMESGFLNFDVFAPYAYYCFKTTMLFYLGIVNDAVTTRSTNKIDLEYLYYLPFCMVFSSGDKFHKDMSALLLREDQTFVDREVLKMDLRRIRDKWQGLNEQEREQRSYDYGSYPPEDIESITHRLWVKYMRPWKPGSGNRALRMTKEENEELIKKLMPMVEAMNKHTKNEK